ncbi:MAG: DedA family protein [Dehalococcoidia bacterium]|jgi:membrane protein DedA with SNARE-associated domain
MILNILEFITGLISSWGYAGIFVTMTLESALIPIPSEAVIPFAGFLAYMGEMNIWLIVLVSSLANVTGSIIAYEIGKYLGRGFIERYGKYVLLNMGHLQLIERWFDKYGSLTVLFCRMLPLVRTVNALPAGIGKMNFPKFCIFTFIGSIPWNLALVFVGYLLKQNWNILEKYSLYIDMLAVFVAAAVIFFIVRRVRVSTKSG